MRIAEWGKLIRPLVNLTSITDVVQVDAALVNVEFVKHSIIANSQLEFGSALKSLVRKIGETRAYLIYPALDSLTHRLR